MGDHGTSEKNGKGAHVFIFHEEEINYPNYLNYYVSAAAA